MSTKEISAEVASRLAGLTPEQTVEMLTALMRTTKVDRAISECRGVPHIVVKQAIGRFLNTKWAVLK